MDSVTQLLLKFIGYFPDYLSASSRMLLHFFWTTFVETAVYTCTPKWVGVLPYMGYSVCAAPKGMVFQPFWS